MVTGHTSYLDLGTEYFPAAAAEIAAGRDNLGQELTGDIQDIEKFFIPFAAINVKEQSSGGICRISNVAAGQVKDQPGIYSTEAEFTILSQPARSGEVVQEPFEFSA
ncbi:hypothetical protein ES708_19105 [subsurface metagenome]